LFHCPDSAAGAAAANSYMMAASIGVAAVCNAFVKPLPESPPGKKL
jgi:hypothetical protein